MGFTSSLSPSATEGSKHVRAEQFSASNWDVRAPASLSHLVEGEFACGYRARKSQALPSAP